jgi:CRP-like cAMP-binding protein
MLDVARPLHRNRLLASLPPDDIALLQAALEPVPLKLRLQLEIPDRPIEHIYFIEEGFASTVAVQAHVKRIEVGVIGREGMSGIAVVLANDRSPHATYMQVAGQGHRIAADKFRKAINASRSLHEVMLKYVLAFMVQTAQGAMANACASLDERLARWILMAHDRVGHETLPLTHELLSLMLGVRRPGVTEALDNFQQGGLLELGRGKIVVVDRKGIEKIGGRYYGAAEAEYRRLFG